MIQARAVCIPRHGEADVLTLGEIAIREPGPGELLIEVAAAGLNRADVLQRRGFYPAPPGVPADVPGLELAGTVRAVGPEVHDFGVGDRVMAIVGGGSMATHVVIHAREAIRVPASLSLIEAAAIPEAFLTAYDALFLQGRLMLGETVLIHAVASGVGTAALQLATTQAAHTIGTSRSSEKLARCTALGLDHALHVEDKHFADAVRTVSGGRGADLVLDTVGAAYLKENLKAMALGGRMVVIGLLGGVQAELPLGLLLSQRLQIRGSVLRSRTLEAKATLAQSFSHHVLPLFESGKLRPVVERAMPMEEVQDAHRLMEQNATFGKIVLHWGN